MTDYLFTLHKSGKVGTTAHLSYDGVSPLCRQDPKNAGTYVTGDLEDMRYVCGDCYRVATQGSWESEDRPVKAVVTCRNGHERIVEGKDFEEDCPECGAPLAEYDSRIESVRFFIDRQKPHEN